jgi:hypothetical protein
MHSTAVISVPKTYSQDWELSSLMETVIERLTLGDNMLAVAMTTEVCVVEG